MFYSSLDRLRDGQCSFDCACIEAQLAHEMLHLSFMFGSYSAGFICQLHGTDRRALREIHLHEALSIDIESGFRYWTMCNMLDDSTTIFGLENRESPFIDRCACRVRGNTYSSARAVVT